MPTIDHALERFLEREREQHPGEMEDAELVVDNLRSFLDSYGYQYTDDDDDEEDDDFAEDEYDYDEDGDGFASTHDAELLPLAMAEFLYYWNIRTFMGTPEEARATGNAVANLMELLAEEGWADRKEAFAAAELGRAAAEELPRAKELASLLYDVAAATPPARADDVDDDVDDFLTITRVESGRLWFTEGVGPIDVPEEASRLAQVGWWVNLAAQRRGRAWFITETGFVYPRMIEDADDESTDTGWADLFPGSPDRLN